MFLFPKKIFQALSLKDFLKKPKRTAKIAKNYRKKGTITKKIPKLQQKGQLHFKIATCTRADCPPMLSFLCV